MCLYVSHIRICCHCSHEDTVLISESLCTMARQSGVFGSCGSGPATQRSPTRSQCWGCKEAYDVRIGRAPPQSRRRITIKSS